MENKSCASKVNERIHLLLPIGKQVFSHIQESRAHHTQWFLEKTNAFTPNGNPFLLYPAVPLWSVWWCSLPAPGALPACLLQGSRRSRKGLGSMHAWLKTSVCYQHFYKKIQNIASYEPPRKKK